MQLGSDNRPPARLRCLDPVGRGDGLLISRRSSRYCAALINRSSMAAAVYMADAAGASAIRDGTILILVCSPTCASPKGATTDAVKSVG